MSPHGNGSWSTEEHHAAHWTVTLVPPFLLLRQDPSRPPVTYSGTAYEKVDSTLRDTRAAIVTDACSSRHHHY